LVKDGFLVVIDWNPTTLPNAETHYTMTNSEMKNIIIDLNFKFKEEIFVSDTHYCLIFTKI
jgi:hypothetical protein